MSTIDSPQSLPVPVDVPGQTAAKFSRAKAPIVPPGSVTGRSLTFVITIMAFLASLTAGGVYLVFNAASTWTNNISSEITVQVQSLGSSDAGDAKIADIVKFLYDQNGIKQVIPYTREQSLKLVEPWIGKSEVLKSFAIPRLIAIEIDRDNPPEISTLKKVMEARYPGAVLDDHGLWRGEIRRVTRFLELSGIAMLALMAAATAAVIIAAATSALASNKEIVSVLNLVGAEEKFIASQFERHFLWVGIKAGVAGAGMAGLAFLALPSITGSMGSNAAAEAEIRRLVGAGTLDWGGYGVLVVVVAAIALICKMTSRYGVRRILNQQNA
ncbi:MAG: cell division protein FtsX [Rhodomicrobium sp.]